MKSNVKTLYNNAVSGDIRSLSKLISLIEVNPDSILNIINDIWPKTGKAHVIGITGLVGAGKSTLIASMTRIFKRMNKKVAIIGIDPSSPLTGGSLLGDRIRLQSALGNEVFMRSMSTLTEGSLPLKALLAVEILDAIGYDYIVIETVGAGQTDVQVMNAVDTVIVVLMPGAGDEIQALKSGLMEIGDIYVINKADKPEAELTLSQVNFALEGVVRKGWKPPIILTAAIMNKGVKDVVNKIIEHKEYLAKTGQLNERRIRRRKFELDLLLKWRLDMKLKELSDKTEVKELIDKALKGVIDPITASKKIFEYIISSSR